MRTTAAVIVSLFAIVGIFFLGRYTVGKTPYDTAVNIVTDRYHQAKNTVTRWFQGSGQPNSDATV
jgi:hypothetical protein